MAESYLMSVCYLDNNTHEIFSEPFGIFKSFEDAEKCASLIIDDLKLKFFEEFEGHIIDVDDFYSFDYTIKKFAM